MNTERYTLAEKPPMEPEPAALSKKTLSLNNRQEGIAFKLGIFTACQISLMCPILASLHNRQTRFRISGVTFTRYANGRVGEMRKIAQIPSKCVSLVRKRICQAMCANKVLPKSART